MPSFELYIILVYDVMHFEIIITRCLVTMSTGDGSSSLSIAGLRLPSGGTCSRNSCILSSLGCYLFGLCLCLPMRGKLLSMFMSGCFSNNSLRL